MRAALRTVTFLAALASLGAAAHAQAPMAPQATGMREASPARLACRAQIDAQSLTGDQRKAAMRTCMEPHVSACRQQAVQKGLAKGPERKEFMRACMQSA